MQVFQGLDRWRPPTRHTAIAIGNFDGVHLGHQKILRSLTSRAKDERLYSLVLTFSPHPEKVLGASRIAMIQTLAQRLAQMRALGVQAVIVTPFDRRFSNLSGQEFVQEIIVRSLRAKAVIVGENFRFGRNRCGTIEDLRQLGSRLGFAVHPIPAVVLKGRVVSSSLIRLLLAQGKIESARVLLGRPYEIEGTVVKGASRGTSLGFPTANIQTRNEITPEGVFFTQAQISRKSYSSVTNIGTRPTFEGRALEIETFLFDFRENAYRKKIKLRFLKKVRAERKFRSAQALVKQIRQDIAAAEEFFAHGNG